MAEDRHTPEEIKDAFDLGQKLEREEIENPNVSSIFTSLGDIIHSDDSVINAEQAGRDSVRCGIGLFS